jgi:hypothetical protein
MKKWWKSKTLWLNVLLAAGTAAEANMGLLRDQFGPQAYLVIISVAAAANAFLRFVTSQPLEK